MSLRMLLPLLVGVLGIVGALSLLSSRGDRYEVAGFLFLISGVLFSAVGVIDLARARKTARVSKPKRLKPSPRLSRSA